LENAGLRRLKKFFQDSQVTKWHSQDGAGHPIPSVVEELSGFIELDQDNVLRVNALYTKNILIDQKHLWHTKNN